MRFDFLPKRILSALNFCDVDKLCEIRLRVDFPILLIFDKTKTFLTDNGDNPLNKNAIIATKNYIDEIIRNVTEYSIYAFNDKIRQGFLTTEDGIRIGLAGDCVYDNENIVTIKNFSSLNIRIPHEIIGCSTKILPYLIDNDSIYNTLIISPPFYGKTTLLKDLARNINNQNLGDILLVDERGEFSSVIGQNIDKINYGSKSFAFNCGIRSLAPKVIITDELGGESDWNCVNKAVISGVKVIASCHAYSVKDVCQKYYFIKGVFERYVVLNNKKMIDGVYDKDFLKL